VEQNLLPELLEQLRGSRGPVERLIAEWEVPAGAAALSIAEGSPVHQVGYAAAFDLIDKLRRQLGPTGDPSSVDELVPGRNATAGDLTDFVFALFRRAPAYVYVRLRGGTGEAPSQLRLVVGAVRIPDGHFGHE
jgi:hypothetical protein